MEYLKVRNWSEYQHYKDRNPPWIKLHYELMTSQDWVGLTDKDRLTMIICMLIASRHDGAVPNDPKYIQRVAYLDSTPNLLPLIESGFLLADASTCKQMLADASVYVSVLDTSSSVILKKKEEEREVVEKVLTYLNEKSGKNFATSGPRSAASSKLVAARLKQGFTEQELCRVVDLKVTEWRGRDMDKFLRPATLFGTKCEQYMGEVNADPKYKNVVDMMREEQELLRGNP